MNRNENGQENGNGNGTELSNEQVEHIVKQKQKRNRPDLANFGQEFIEPGDNTKYLSFALESMNMPKLDFTNVPAVQERINWYFLRCAKNDLKPGVVGLANALGVDRKTLWAWKVGQNRANTTPELIDVIKKAYVLLEEMWEQYMQNGKISPPNGIFLGKNHFDYRDEQQVVVTPNSPYQGASEEELKQKYISDMATDGEEKK